MLKLTMGNKEYKIQFAYLPTLKSHIMSRIAKISGDNQSVEDIEELMLLIPELLLVGLQKYHKKEFGYNYRTEEDKEKPLDKVCDMVDDYMTDTEESPMDLFEKLVNEMMNESFLSRMFKQEQNQPETQETSTPSLETEPNPAEN